MWDDILEVVAEVMLDCAVETSGKKKPILILLAVLAWLAVVVLLLWVGIAESDMSLIGLGIVLVAALALWIYLKIKKYQK